VVRPEDVELEAARLRKALRYWGVKFTSGMLAGAGKKSGS
jgi:hypothetical protein